MKRETAQKLVEEYLPVFLDILNLTEHEIQVSLGRCDDKDNAGECVRYYDYRRADITINPSLIDTEQELKNVLLHELCHVLHSPWDLFYRTAKEAAATDKMRNILDGVFDHAQESSVSKLERVFSGLIELAATARVQEPSSADQTEA